MMDAAFDVTLCVAADAASDVAGVSTKIAGDERPSFDDSEAAARS